ncbi:MAG TPA: hypothetical protein VGO86_18965, partial [Candidatus Dormibacteraeota bacterium]
GDWKQRLAFLFSELPFRYEPLLRAHPSPSEVLDLLFDVQGRLFDMKRRRSMQSGWPVWSAGSLVHGLRTR